MKKALRYTFVLAVLSLGVGAAYAPCFYPHSTTTYYWQFHQSCSPPDSRGFRICTEYWSLDGECNTDCEGNTWCYGDTEIRYRTMTEHDMQMCDPICE